MKVIFLDVDGVLNSEETFVATHEVYKRTGEHLPDICENMVKRLGKIVKATGAVLIMSSSWRGMYFRYLNGEPNINCEGLCNMLRKYDMDIEGYTPMIYEKGTCNSRGYEIRSWLSEHNDVESFIVLDDEVFKDFGELENNLIKTTFYGKDGGLCDEHIIKAISILNDNK